MSTDKWFALAAIFPCSPSGHNFSLLPKHLLYPHCSEDQDLCAHRPRCCCRDDVTLWATGAPLSVLQVHTLSLHHGVSCERSHIQERQRPSFILCLRQRQPCTTFTEQRGGGSVSMTKRCTDASLFESVSAVWGSNEPTSVSEVWIERTPELHKFYSSYVILLRQMKIIQRFNIFPL